MESEGPPERLGPLHGDVQGKVIVCPDGPVGRVADVLVDPLTERPRYLIWREALLVTREVSIPVDYIERIEEDGIVLRVERKAIERLPRFWMADSEGKENDAAGT